MDDLALSSPAFGRAPGRDLPARRPAGPRQPERGSLASLAWGDLPVEDGAPQPDPCEDPAPGRDFPSPPGQHPREPRGACEPRELGGPLQPLHEMHLRELNSVSWSPGWSSRDWHRAGALDGDLARDINAASWSSRGSAALNLCEVNTASWSSRVSNSLPHWMVPDRAALARSSPRATAVDARPSSVEEEADPAGVLWEINTASWGSAGSHRAWFSSLGAARGVPSGRHRSVQEVMEDLALSGGQAGPSEATSGELPGGSRGR